MTNVDIVTRFLNHKDFSKARREVLVEKKLAMPGGRYPIENRQDLKNAIQAFGRAKNKAATKAWIIKRAKDLGLTDLLPEGWLEHSDLAGEIIEHYGVKGQKWGVRRQRKPSQSHLTKVASVKGKKAFELSDDELRTYLDRINMEQRHGNYNPGTLARGQRIAGTVLAAGATANAAIALAKSPVGQTIAKKLKG